MEAHIASHKRDADFSVTDYILNHSPLSPFLKYIKADKNIVDTYGKNNYFVYVTYCIYARIFLENGLTPQDSYTALGFYQKSDRDNIGFYKTTVHALRKSLRKSLDIGNIKTEREASLKNIHSIITTGKTNGNYADFGEKAIAYLLSGDINKLTSLTHDPECLELIKYSLVRKGWLRELFGRLNVTLKNNVISYAGDNVKEIFNIELKNINKEAALYQQDIEDTLYRLENFLLIKEHDMDINVTYTESAIGVPQEVLDLANRLASKHSQATISQGSSGYHISIPDPELLETDGIKELSSKHLSINAEKYLGIGRYNVDMFPTKENRMLWVKYREKGKEVPCAVSMKTQKPYYVKDLLCMKPINERGLSFGNIQVKSYVSSDNTDIIKYMEEDETGTLVPSWCGLTVPISALKPEHPAVEYLQSRGFDINKLYENLDIQYCVSAIYKGEDKKKYSSRLANGMKNTMEGRIIIPSWVNGHRTGYQGRIIDKKDSNNYYVWDGLRMRTIVQDGVNLYPPTAEFPKGFSPHKYLNAPGSRRNTMLIGFDQAVKWNKEHNHSKELSFCIIVEGPFDAAKIGPPAIAILGNVLSQQQATLIRSSFGRVILVADTDKAGKAGANSCHRMLEPCPIDDIELIGHKDAGELSYEEAKELVKQSRFYFE